MLVGMWWKENPCILLKGKLVMPLWKTLWKFFKKLKVELPYEPAISLLGIHSKKQHTNSRRCMHPNVHSSIIYNCKIRKWLKCPPTGEWMKRCGMCIIWITFSYRKEWTFAICSNMDGPGGNMLSEISHTGTNKFYLPYFICKFECMLTNHLMNSV